MPRFFFDICDDAVSRDGVGIELADAETARDAALAGAREMMCAQMRKGRLSLHYRIEVRDEGGRAILSIAFGDAVEIETAPPRTGCWARR